MKLWRATVTGIALSSALLATTAAQAGVVMVSEHARGAGGSPSVSTLYIQGNQMRMESPGGAGIALYDGERQRFIAIDTKQQRYTEMTAAQLQAAQVQVQQSLQQMNAQMEQMKAQLSQLPPAQRQMVEKMMAQQQGTGMPGTPPPVKPTFAKVGSEMLGKWTCEHYVGTVNGKQHAEAWMATEATLGVRPEDLAVLKSYRQQFVTSMSQTTPTSLYGNGIDELPGVPIKTVQYDEHGQAQQSVVLKSIEQRTLEPTLFTIPAGMMPQTLPSLPTGQ